MNEHGGEQYVYLLWLRNDRPNQIQRRSHVDAKNHFEIHELFV